jgi:predicted RNase H-like HicB family nuclease
MPRDETLAVTIVYERIEGDHYQAMLPAFPGVITAGRTRAEARRKVRDALRMMLTAEPVDARTGRDTEQLELRIGHARPTGLDRVIDR